MRNHHVALMIILLSGAANAQGGPTKDDILNYFGNERHGEVVRVTDPEANFPIAEYALSDKLFCEPFLSRNQEHWHCTFMLKWRREAIGGGRSAEERNASAIEKLQSAPWKESRTEVVLLESDKGYSAALDYVQKLENGYTKIFDGPLNCIQIVPGRTGPSESFLPCNQSEAQGFNGQDSCHAYSGPGPDREHPWRSLPGYGGDNIILYYACEPDPVVF